MFLIFKFQKQITFIKIFFSFFRSVTDSAFIRNASETIRSGKWSQHHNRCCSMIWCSIALLKELLITDCIESVEKIHESEFLGVLQFTGLEPIWYLKHTQSETYRHTYFPI